MYHNDPRQKRGKKSVQSNNNCVLKNADPNVKKTKWFAFCSFSQSVYVFFASFYGFHISFNIPHTFTFQRSNSSLEPTSLSCPRISFTLPHLFWNFNPHSSTFFSTQKRKKNKPNSILSPPQKKQTINAPKPFYPLYQLIHPFDVDHPDLF